MSQLATTISALTAIGALVFTGLSLQQTQRQADIAERGLATERFAKAVEQLSNENSIDSRLGGVYALGRTSRDSAAESAEVSQLLSAFARRKRAIPACDIGFDLRDVDVAAALRTITARNTDPPPDLGQTCLTGVRLRHALPRCARLNGAFLESGTDLAGADLSGANLTGARLRNADLSGAFLANTTLADADLTGAKVAGAHIHGGDLVADLLRRGARDDDNTPPAGNCPAP